MYRFHYEYIKNKFDARLLFTYTDEIYEIKTKYVYKDFFKDKDLFGFSCYPLDSKFFDPTDKKVIGKMKDEFKGEIISDFVGLRSKMCSLIGANDKEVKKAKRINKSVVKKIRHDEFVSVLFNKKAIRHNMKRIQSKLHRIGTYDICKVSLSCFDDKRYILDDGVNTLAYFHKDIAADV